MNLFCMHIGCIRNAKYTCDHCYTPFCSDHGSEGGDHEGDDTIGPYAVPSACWRCGGFNADA